MIRGLSAKRAAQATSAATLGGAIGLAIPWTAGLIVDQLAPAGLLAQIALATLGLIVAGVATALLAYVGGLANQHLWAGWERHAMGRALSRFLAAPPDRDLPAAGVLERLRGASQAREALAAAGMTAAGALAVLAASGGYLFWHAPLVGALTLAGLLTLSGLTALLYLRQTAARIASAEAESAATGFLSAALRIRLDAGHGSPAKALETTWWRIHARRLDGTATAQAWRDAQRALDTAIGALAPAGLIAAVATFVPGTSPGDLAAMFAAFGQCLMAAFGLSWAIAALSQAQEGWRMLSSLPGGEAQTSSATPETDGAVVEINALGFGYVPDCPVLDDLSLTLAPGERLAVMGPSGVGKSTLVRLIAGLIAPDRGEIRLCGVDPCALGPEDRRGLIGVVTAEVPLFGGSIAEEAGTRDPDVLDWAQQATRTRRTQILLARAFAHRPRLIVLDEAFGPLEAPAIDAVFDRARDAGAALLAVCHDPEMAARCDRILHLRAP